MLLKKGICFFLLLLGISLILFCADRWNQGRTPYLSVIGGIHMPDGLGRQSVELIDALKQSIKINFIPTYIVNGRMNVPDWMSEFLKGKRKKKRLGKIVFCEEPIEYGTPKLRSFFRDKTIRIAYSMFESSRISEAQVKRLNLYFDLVAVPDPFLIEVYQKSGVTIPIFVLPLGRNFTDFLNSPLKKGKNHPFVFGSFGYGIHRKNHVTLIRAFAKAFQGRKDVVLAIHCRNLDPNVRWQIQKEIAKTEGVEILFTEGYLNQDAFVDFMRSIDCYVSPSKGEGFSIQPREAMAMGIPTIATDNTAQHTICKSGLVRSIPSEIEEPAFYEWGGDVAFGSFFGCREDDLANAMKDVEQNYDSYLALGLKARNWAALYDFEKVKPLYMTIVGPKRVILGPENKITDDFLMTSSKKLYEKYQRITVPF